MTFSKRFTYDRLGSDKMIQVSLCMIVKNEEEVLERCLNSIHDIVDEVIIVDTGSDDLTKEIAQRYSDKVFDFTWCDDFSKARNYAFSKATKSYCMWLDADDVLKMEDKNKLKTFLQTHEPNFDVLMMKYNTGFDEQGNLTFSYFRERIVRNDGHHIFEGIIHEAIVPSGIVIHEDIAITHQKLHVQDSDRNLRILNNQKINSGLRPREQYYYARELYYHKLYEDAINEFSQFLDGGKGWIENNIDACRIRGHCYKAIQKEKEAFESYLHSFYYASPRSEIICDIAYHFFQNERYHEAIFWYELAARQTPDETTGAFIEKDCYGFTPYLQLCVCYDRLHDQQKAIYYNELAGFLKPNNDKYLYNREYFRKKDA